MIMFRRDVTGCHSLRCLRPETLQQSLIGGEDEVGVEKGLEASPLAAKLQPSEGPEGRGRGVRSRHPRPSREPQTRSARGLPAGWGLLRPSARSCLSAGSASPASTARRRGNATATAPPRRGARARGRGPYSPGPPPPPPPPPPRRPIPAAGACRRAASLQSPPPAGPAPPPAQRLRSGPLLRPGLGRRRRSATWPPLRRLATPFRAREAERGRGAGGGGGGCAGGMCARGGREAGGSAPARAYPRPREPPLPPRGRDPDTSPLPPPAPSPAVGSARMRSPRLGLGAPFLPPATM
ncbi:hypothetical protein ACRRTK_007460 [Alexandromys fortis]